MSVRDWLLSSSLIAVGNGFTGSLDGVLRHPLWSMDSKDEHVVQEPEACCISALLAETREYPEILGEVSSSTLPFTGNIPGSPGGAE